MKRYAAPLILLAALAALAVVGTAGANHQVKSPVKGSFRYCSDPTFPPMESTTTAGKPTGFDIDMANAIGKFWKVKAKFVQTAFPGLLPALSAKKCNMVISGIFIRLVRVNVIRTMKDDYIEAARALMNALPGAPTRRGRLLGCRNRRGAQRLAPEHPGARGQQDDRPHDGVGEPDPERPHREQEGEGHEAHAE